MTAASYAPPPAPSGLSLWLMAARPRTLTLGATPVAVGAALAWAEAGHVSFLVVLGALIGALAIQIGTNLYNDAADFERGADGPDRVGPPRITALGLRTVTQVKRAALLCFGVAALAGIYLIAVGGWPIMALGVLSLIAGWAYTGGPVPIAYTPLGEIFVLLFFGLGAVCGTYWLNAHGMSPTAIAAGVAVGLFASALLLVNNHRDAANDARAGRHTLAICAGPQLAMLLYAGMMLAPFALLPLIGDHLPATHPWWLAMASLPFALLAVRRFTEVREGQGFNAILARTAQVQLLFALLLCLGLVV